MSKHLRLLSDAGLVEVGPVAQQRIYALRPEPLQELEVWLQRCRRRMEEQFERLDQVLLEMKARKKTSIKKPARRTASKLKPRQRRNLQTGMEHGAAESYDKLAEMLATPAEAQA